MIYTKAPARESFYKKVEIAFIVVGLFMLKFQGIKGLVPFDLVYDHVTVTLSELISNNADSYLGFVILHTNICILVLFFSYFC